MGEVVNLRRRRKQAARETAAAQAADNRARFGRTKQERDANRSEAARLEAHLDGHRRDPGPPNKSRPDQP